LKVSPEVSRLNMKLKSVMGTQQQMLPMVIPLGNAAPVVQSPMGFNLF
jgi:hypothetical protein